MGRETRRVKNECHLYYQEMFSFQGTLSRTSSSSSISFEHHTAEEFQLQKACKSGDLVTVRKLLDEGIDVNWKNQSGMTAFMWASGRGHIEVMKLLLDRGAKANMRDNSLWTALMKASYHGKVDSVRLLLERGADTYIKHGHGMTAKDIAKREGKGDIVHLLDEVRICQNQDRIFSYRHTCSYNFSNIE
jgi:ankyrin repeat protein